jgi:hypothetical protein
MNPLFPPLFQCPKNRGPWFPSDMAVRCCGAEFAVTTVAVQDDPHPQYEKLRDCRLTSASHS